MGRVGGESRSRKGNELMAKGTPTGPLVDEKGNVTSVWGHWFNDLLENTIKTLANNATPSIEGGKIFLTGGTTTITDFDDGYEGQVITIIAEHSITITDGTNIYLDGSANWDMTATDTLTLICKADNKWYELSRGDNGA